ncbi:putative MPP superfamily phosphohydrolase [Pseudomonas sp. GGS8]|uniref:metallophosphoesterase n=1 Tax=Pseudomonas sp. GGS8 TaxID=2817892 RepID=UPI00209E1C63|nr:metallophosphoesterase [Pseudomonas sp. GGS8]MCP1442497.1 putative MPP superfamily phosphohydrolase [Pseudomonas sp. GGS8]
MLMLHISDIHFKSPECLQPEMDPDYSIRTRMMRDLQEQVKTLGKVGAILIGGDIAYRAAPAEYQTAQVWIEQLADISGCPKERIFVVPGNHDVDRAVIKASVPIQNVQHAISSASLQDREWKLRQQLGDAASGQLLLEAHAAYNAFAARFMCQIWPSKPFWHQDIVLDAGVSLRIYGLTSTLLSGREGQDDKERGLYLSPLQTVLNPAPNTLNMVLCHHPIDWLEDGEVVEDALNTRAAFQVFGHKHKQRLHMDASYVRLAAAAVNPSRREQPYNPGYNLIQLKVAGAGEERRVDVRVYQRRLQDVPEMFIAMQSPQRKDYFASSISIPEEGDLRGSSCDTVTAETPATKLQDHLSESQSIQDAEATMGEEDTRDLLYRFWSLSSSQRRQIAVSLNLLEPGEMKLPEPERYGRALIRAAQLDIMDKIAAEVAKLEN